MPASIPDSDADRFCRSQRAALLADASITEKKMFGTTARFDPGHGRTSATWAAVFAGTSDEWPRLAREARACVGG